MKSKLTYPLLRNSWAVFWLIAMVSTPLFAQDDRQSQILDNWQRIESSVHSLTCAWTGKRIVYANSIRFPEQSPDGGRRTATFPDEDTAVTIESEFSMRGDESRVTFSGLIFSSTTQGFLHQTRTRIYGSQAHGTIRTYRNPGDASLYPVGTLGPPKLLWTDNFRYFQPLRLAFRPFSGFARGGKLTSRTGMVAGKRCLIFENYRDPSTREEAWVDAEDLSTVWRFVYQINDLQHLSIDLQYTMVDNVKVPDRWEIRVLDDGNVLAEKVSAEMGQVDINPDLAPDEFLVQFPPDIKVHDHSGAQRVSYISREAGRRIIRPFESEADFADLLNSESGMAGGSPKSGRLVYLTGMVLLVASVVFLFRKLRGTTGQGSGK